MESHRMRWRFGDNENDRAMLEFVGHPYLMEVCNPTMENIVAERCKKSRRYAETVFVGPPSQRKFK